VTNVCTSDAIGIQRPMVRGDLLRILYEKGIHSRPTVVTMLIQEVAISICVGGEGGRRMQVRDECA
jgi:hypothetical protein